MATSMTPQTQSMSRHTDEGSPAARVVTAPSWTTATEAVSPPEKGEPSGPGLSPPVPLRARNIVPSAPQVKPRGLAMPSATICVPVAGVASWARDVRGSTGTSNARASSNANAKRDVERFIVFLRSEEHEETEYRSGCLIRALCRFAALRLGGAMVWLRKCD